MSIGIYAMGGGYGHIARTCALARRLLQLRVGLKLHLYLPKRAQDWMAEFGLKAEFGPSRSTDLARWIEHRIAADRPELLIVDCFPTGFYGELAGVLPMVDKKVFLTRWLDPTSVVSQADSEALAGFSRRICTEVISAEFEALAFKTVEPILAVSAEEVLERETARELLGLSDSRKLVLFTHTRFDAAGHLADTQLEKLSQLYDFDLIKLGWGSKLWQKTLPLARWMRVADLVVAPAGHNSYYEIVQAGVPAILIPFELLNDNHQQRSTGELGASHSAMRSAMPGSLMQLFPEMLHQQLQPRRPFKGDVQAAALVLETLDSVEANPN